MILIQLTGAARLPLLAGLPLMAVQMALLEWYRAAELSADRAATLVNRDPLVTCRTLMVMAGGASSRKLDLDAFIRQAGEYEDWSSGWDKLNRLRSELFLTHSHPVRRVKEVTAWVHSGDYDRIVDGEYPTRDQQADARKEAGEAFEFYKDRFRKIFNEFGGEKAKERVADAAEKVGDWLKSNRPGTTRSRSRRGGRPRSRAPSRPRSLARAGARRRSPLARHRARADPRASWPSRSSRACWPTRSRCSPTPRTCSPTRARSGSRWSRRGWRPGRRAAASRSGSGARRSSPRRSTAPRCSCWPA